MKDDKSCPACRGTGIKPIPRGLQTCFYDSRKVVIAQMNGVDLTRQDVERMVGG